MYVIQCDKCKTQAEPTHTTATPETWRRITFTQGYPHKQITFDLCPECIFFLKLPSAAQKEMSLGDQLLSIIEDIAMDAAEDARE